MRVTVIATAIALAVAPAASSIAATPTPAARSVLRLDTNGAGHAVVALTRPLRHPYGVADLRVTVSGNGRFDGLVLLPRKRSLSADTISLAVGSLAASGRAHPTIILGTSADPLPNVLPAATYDVYVAAAGRVRITISLPNQPAGTATVRMAPTHGVEVLRTNAASAAGLATPTAALGETLRPRHGAFLVDLDWKNVTAQTTNIAGGCIYPGGGSTLDYETPGCIHGYGGEVDGILDLRTSTSTLNVGWVHFTPGTWGYKSYFAAVAASTAGGIELLSITS